MQFADLYETLLYKLSQIAEYELNTQVPLY